MIRKSKEGYRTRQLVFPVSQRSFRHSCLTGNQPDVQARLQFNYRSKMAVAMRCCLSFILILVILASSWLIAVLLDYYTGHGQPLKSHKRTNTAPFPNGKMENLFWFLQVGISWGKRFHFRTGLFALKQCFFIYFQRRLILLLLLSWSPWGIKALSLLYLCQSCLTLNER